MKKKLLKQLTVSRETLAQLERGAVGGGVTTPPDCDFSNYNQNTCFTYDLNTCRTNCC